MSHRAIIFVLLMSVSVVASGAAEGDTGVSSDTSEVKAQLPAKKTAEYWVIRSQAITELIPFLTDKRAEFKDTYRLMGQYLDKVGKRVDYHRSGIKAPDTAETYVRALGLSEKLEREGVKLPDKPPTWEQIVEVAMQHVLYEGYMPTQLSGGDELTMIKKICGQKEAYGQKVRKELREVVKSCMDIWTYLGPIDKQAECRVYVEREKEAARLAHEKELQERREARAEAGRQKRDQQRAYREAQEQERRQQNIWVNRQAKLRTRYSGRYRW
ncbi:MAG: hypothetical protein ACYTFW_10775 [Planctomycetota bacterium]|jgi:hypothetical protein